MPDSHGRFRGQGWSRAREDGWERAFGKVSLDELRAQDWGMHDAARERLIPVPDGPSPPPPERLPKHFF